MRRGQTLFRGCNTWLYISILNARTPGRVPQGGTRALSVPRGVTVGTLGKQGGLRKGVVNRFNVALGEQGFGSKWIQAQSIEMGQTIPWSRQEATTSSGVPVACRKGGDTFLTSTCIENHIWFVPSTDAHSWAREVGLPSSCGTLDASHTLSQTVPTKSNPLASRTGTCQVLGFNSLLPGHRVRKICECARKTSHITIFSKQNYINQLESSQEGILAEGVQPSFWDAGLVSGVPIKTCEDEEWNGSVTEGNTGKAEIEDRKRSSERQREVGLEPQGTRKSLSGEERPWRP